MASDETMEDISGINFLKPVFNASQAVEELFAKFPEEWQSKYGCIIDFINKQTTTLVVANMFPAKTKKIQSNIINIILAALGSFSITEDLLKDWLEDVPNFISQTQSNNNFATLEDIDSAHEFSLEAVDVLRKLYKFEENVYDELED